MYVCKSFIGRDLVLAARMRHRLREKRSVARASPARGRVRVRVRANVPCRESVRGRVRDHVRAQARLARTETRPTAAAPTAPLAAVTNLHHTLLHLLRALRLVL